MRVLKTTRGYFSDSGFVDNPFFAKEVGEAISATFDYTVEDVEYRLDNGSTFPEKWYCSDIGKFYDGRVLTTNGNIREDYVQINAHEYQIWKWHQEYMNRDVPKDGEYLGEYSPKSDEVCTLWKRLIFAYTEEENWDMVQRLTEIVKTSKLKQK